VESETSSTAQTAQSEKIQSRNRTSREISLPQGDLSQLNIRDIVSENQTRESESATRSTESNPVDHTREPELTTHTAETKSIDPSKRTTGMSEFSETTVRETFSFGVQLYAQWLNGEEDTEEKRAEFVEIIRPAIQEGFENARAMFGALPKAVEKAFEHTRDQIIGAFEGFVENGTGWTPEELELAQAEEGLATINEFKTAVQEKADRMLGLLNEAVTDKKSARKNDKAEAGGFNTVKLNRDDNQTAWTRTITSDETASNEPASNESISNKSTSNEPASNESISHNYNRVPVMYGQSGSSQSYETAGQVIDFTA